MLLKSFVTTGFLLISSISAATAVDRTPIAQAELTARQVLTACVENRAETLPNPYTDVSPSHWAYKAVLTMHYCGAYRQATPPSLVDRLVNERSPQPVQ